MAAEDAKSDAVAYRAEARRTAWIFANVCELRHVSSKLILSSWLESIGVVGAGGWGTALAKVLADKGERVTLWCHGADSFRELTEPGKPDLSSRHYAPGKSWLSLSR